MLFIKAIVYILLYYFIRFFLQYLPRKLLLNRLEINRIKDKINQKGATVVPLKLYWVRGRVKLEIGVAKGKKDYDKRQDIKAKDWQRDKQRELKEGLR